MQKRFTVSRLAMLMSAVSTIGFSVNAYSSGFQLWEQDGASIGNYHAGRAAVADDASTNFYNPAGLVNIQNQQVIIGASPILTNFSYRGTVAVNTLGDIPQSVTNQGGGFNLVPDLHYASPVSDHLVFGFSVVSPFGLRTDYGYQTDLRYASTLTSLQVIDMTPSLGYAITPHLSIGAGVDIERASLESDLVATLSESSLDTDASAKGWSTSYGYHMGALYQFNPETRVGLSYQSKVKHHFRGHSTFTGPLANDGEGGQQYAGNFYTAITLPATTSLSAFHEVNKIVDVMGSITYTQWNVFKDLVMENVAGIEDHASSDNITVDTPQNFHNTWNYSVGGNIHINQQFFIRTGLGYDQSPTNNSDRSVQLPDSDKIALALGGHYQATHTLAFDLSWTHLFPVNPSINTSQTVGDQVTTTDGTVNANADIYGLQVKWDIT